METPPRFKPLAPCSWPSDAGGGDAQRGTPPHPPAAWLSVASHHRGQPGVGGWGLAATGSKRSSGLLGMPREEGKGRGLRNNSLSPNTKWPRVGVGMCQASTPAAWEITRGTQAELGGGWGSLPWRPLMLCRWEGLTSPLHSVQRQECTPAKSPSSAPPPHQGPPRLCGYRHAQGLAAGCPSDTPPRPPLQQSLPGPPWPILTA